MSSVSRLGGTLFVYSATAVLVAAGVAVGAARYQRPQPPVAHLFAPPVAEPIAPAADPHVLRVCADPNDLPYSNAREEGFENAVATLVAGDLHRRLAYVWQPQRRGFIRTTLNAGACDVVIGVPAEYDMAATTAPYYRSSYVFVARARGTRKVGSLDDPRLRAMRIGVQIVGEDYENPPPVHALAARGLGANVRGYTVYGDYGSDAPQRGIVEAVANGEVDVAIAWGPLAGYFASRSRVPLQLTPVAAVKDASMPFAFAIAMGVRRGDQRLARELNGTIARRRLEIRRILERFGVPLVG